MAPGPAAGPGFRVSLLPRSELVSARRRNLSGGSDDYPCSGRRTHESGAQKTGIEGTLIMERKRARRGATLICGVAIFGMALAGPVGAAPHKPAKPGAPTITSIKVGVRNVTVSFAKPADNGGSRILNYRVVCTSSNGGRRGANEGLRSPIKVSGLNLKTYTCTVAARNKAGLGPASAPSDPFTPKAHK